MNIRSSVQELEKEFVVNLSENRKELFVNYVSYSQQLKNRLDGVDLLQWIDGSYVTKEKTPSDIDLITFINFEVIAGKEEALEDFKYPKSLELFGVDAYIVKEYPRDHRFYPLFIGDRSYWIDKFEKTRRNRAGNRFPKGWLEIIY